MTKRKITFIGGGSYQWVPTLFRDIAVNLSLEDAIFVLHDIHEERNSELASVCRTIARKLHSAISIEMQNHLPAALDGADIVILCLSTGGLEAMAHDIEIPKKYGIYQPVGDSTGPGGIARTLRNIPVVVDIAREMERFCPDAWLLNLSNPMGQIVAAISRSSDIKVVGLCHEFMSFMGKAAGWLGIENWREHTSAVIAGVNHFAWITDLNVDGRDGLEMLRGISHRMPVSGQNGALVNVSEKLSEDQVKFELFELYGVMPFPGDRHIVEFLPNFLSARNRHAADYGVGLTSIEDRRVNWMGHFMKRIEEWTSGGDDSVPREPSDESLAPIVEALLGGAMTVQPVTVPNEGQIVDLPLGSSVETLATFSRDLLAPHVSGPLPPAVRALVHKHCLIQDLTVEAGLDGCREKALQAMVADPLNSLIDYRDVQRLLEEMLQANRELLPQFFKPDASRQVAPSPLVELASLPACHRIEWASTNEKGLMDRVVQSSDSEGPRAT